MRDVKQFSNLIEYFAKDSEEPISFGSKFFFLIQNDCMILNRKTKRNITIIEIVMTCFIVQFNKKWKYLKPLRKENL